MKNQLFLRLLKLQKKKYKNYGAKKTEILIGSATISQENWIQDLDDEMGQIMRGACRRI